MMLKPIGRKYSQNYYDVALMNLARLNKWDIGAQLHEGANFYAGLYDGNPAFVVEFLGPDFVRADMATAPGRFWFPFTTREERRKAFRQACERFFVLRPHSRHETRTGARPVDF